MLTTSTTSSKNLLDSSSKRLSKDHKDYLNYEDIVQVMVRKLGTIDFHVKHWSLDPISEANGFVGQYYNLRVTCCVKNNKTPEKFVFFAKTCPPHNTPQFDFVIRNDVINKEIRIYEDFMPQMGAANGTDWKVNCYLGKKDIIIVLEDATHQGYFMPDKLIPFGYEECTVLLRSLAKFHSRSLILDENSRRCQGKTINDMYGEILKEIMYNRSDNLGRQIIALGIEGACSTVDLVEGLNDKLKHKLRNRIVKWSCHIPELFQPSDKYRSVACHRDVWANNFMIKHDSTGRPVNCYLVDFQCLCYLPPAVDFMISLHMNTRRKIRDEHFEDFAKMYHEYMRKELDNEEIDIDDCLTWEQFRESCESYKCLAIIYAAVNLHVLLMDQKWAEEYLKRTPEFCEKTVLESVPLLVVPYATLVKEYRERIIENILDIIEYLPDDLP